MYNITEKYYNKKNKIYDFQPLITENNIDNKKRNNNYFGFFSYIKLHSLNYIKNLISKQINNLFL